uniref:Protein NLRC3-like n=1 Tax=Poecilia reticulata TaxID=8081 RepID=A0A3P9PE24_POERE
KSAVPTSEELILRALKDLGDTELKEFKWYLQKSEVLGDFPIIPKSRIDKADRTDTVDQMIQTYCESTLEVTKKVLRKLESKAQEEIFIEMNLTIKETKEFSTEHEIRQIESASRKIAKPEKTIRYDDIFKGHSRTGEPIKMVMTTGMAGIGKTVLTQKFTQNWAEGKANQDFHFTFPLSFRELNAVKDKKFKLVDLVQQFFPETREVDISNSKEFRVIVILDGLDESRLSLDFIGNKKVTDPKESASVDVLLTSLIQGTLLPSANIWITSRPTAASQIPAKHVDMVTEVTGFDHAQKLQYFRKKCRDDKLVSKIMPYINASQNLKTLCHMPVCCWITATVLEDLLKNREEEELPKTLAELYIKFLLVQFRQKAVTEAETQWNPSCKEKILTLGKLAFEQLQKGNLIFDQSDLRGSGINIKSVSVFTGMFPEIFKEEGEQDQATVFCFTHLSVQEFLAALYVHLTFMTSQVNVLEEMQSSWIVMLARPLQSPKGDLDMFLRFLLGLLLPSSQSLLKGLVKETENNTQVIQEAIKYIKDKLDAELPTEQSINLLYCLNELNDNSLVEEIQRFMSSGRLAVDNLSSAQWSALVFILLAEKEMDMFDLKMYSSSEEAFMRLLPVVKTAKRVWYETNLYIFFNQLLKTTCIEVLSSVLSSQNSILKELDLSYNNLGDAGVGQLAVGLESPNCSLETLRLSGCKLTWRSCDTLATIISSQCSLRELDVSNNDLTNTGLQSLSGGLENPQCKLETLRISGCQVTEEGCHYLVTALNVNPSHLRELDLSYNNPGHTGVSLLSSGVKHKMCRLETLKYETEKNCDCGEGGAAVPRSPRALRLLLLAAALQNPADRPQLLGGEEGGTRGHRRELQTNRPERTNGRLPAGLERPVLEPRLHREAVFLLAQQEGNGLHHAVRLPHVLQSRSLCRRPRRHHVFLRRRL